MRAGEREARGRGERWKGQGKVGWLVEMRDSNVGERWTD
jgi:hypothetical protein